MGCPARCLARRQPLRADACGRALRLCRARLLRHGVRGPWLSSRHRRATSRGDQENSRDRAAISRNQIISRRRQQKAPSTTPYGREVRWPGVSRRPALVHNDHIIVGKQGHASLARALSGRCSLSPLALLRGSAATLFDRPATSQSARHRLARAMSAPASSRGRHGSGWPHPGYASRRAMRTLRPGSVTSHFVELEIP